MTAILRVQNVDDGDLQKLIDETEFVYDVDIEIVECYN